MQTFKTFHIGRSVLTVVAAAATLLLIFGDRTSDAGIQGSGRARIASYGRITGLDRLVVNGIPYGISHAQIHVNGTPSAVAALQIGDVVQIQGTLDPSGASAEAETVSLDADLIGTVTKVDASESAFTVLGQTVRVTDETVFADSIQPASLAGMQPGSPVQISGFANSSGELIASRIDTDLGSSGDQIRGTVQNLNARAKTFRLNALTVDYSTAPAAGPLATGALVIVRGSALPSTGVLMASSVQISSGMGAADDRGAVEGIVTRFTSATSFEVNGQRISTDSSTQFVPKKVLPRVDTAVEAQGLFDSDGVLVASKVKVKKTK
jgi:hypothetical protein